VPDGQGRYSLAEMEDRVFRALKMNQAQVNTTTRAETANYYPGQAFSNVDVDQQINASLVGLYSKVILNREDQFSQTFYVSVGAGNRGPYGFPPNTMQVRYMDWLEPGSCAWNQAEERHWRPMLMMDDPVDRPIEHNSPGPSWKYDLSGTAFVLGRTPHSAWQNAVRIKAVVMPPYLYNSTDYIQARFVRQMQEAVILDAAFVLATSRRLNVAQEIAPQKDEAEATLIATAENAHHPPSVVGQSSRMPANTYSGRRRRAWR
jgi:hypothetical protein